MIVESKGKLKNIITLSEKKERALIITIPSFGGFSLNREDGSQIINGDAKKIIDYCNEKDLEIVNKESLIGFVKDSLKN